jgi:hypothetical protein
MPALTCAVSGTTYVPQPSPSGLASGAPGWLTGADQDIAALFEALPHHFLDRGCGVRIEIS